MISFCLVSYPALHPVCLKPAIMRTAVLALIVAPAAVLGQVALWGQCKSCLTMTFEGERFTDIIFD